MKIAITGSIGSGKSSVKEYLKDLGFKVFDCDEYNAYLLNDENVLNNIKEYFPDCFIDNKLDKKLLANIIFNDDKSKEILENILHPLIIEKMLSLANQEELFIAEVPLLFEKDLESHFDHHLLIVTDEKKIIKRLMKKGYSKEEAISRLNKQMSIEDKIKRAEEIIYNNGNLRQLHRKIDKWLKKYVG